MSRVCQVSNLVFANRLYYGTDHTRQIQFTSEEVAEEEKSDDVKDDDEKYSK